jgi:PAS domain S-box-containing protein
MFKTLFSKLSIFLIFLQLLLFLSVYIGFNDTLTTFIAAERQSDKVKFERLFNSSIAPSLFSEEYASIQRFLEDIKNTNPGLTFIRVTDIDGRDIAAIGAINESEKNIESIDLQLSGEIVGNADYYFSNEHIAQLYSIFLQKIAVIIIVIAVFGIFLISIATRFITQGLTRLHQASIELAEGRHPEIIENPSSDEIGELTKNFNNMVFAITERTKELTRKEHELDTIIDNIPSMLFVKDANDLRFIRFNKAGEILTGKTKEQLLGHNDYDFFPKSQADFFIENDRYVLGTSQSKEILEESIDTPNGTRLLHTKKVAIKDEYGKPIMLLGISEDITEQKQAEELLRISEEKHRLAMEASRDGIWDWDIVTGKVDFSPGWCRMIGETQVGNDYFSWESRIFPGDKERVLNSLTKHLEGQTSFWQAEHRLQHQNGSWVWVLGRGKIVKHDENGKPLRMVGTMLDIEKQKAMEKDLELSRDSLEILVQQRTAELEIAKEKAETANQEKSEFLANMSHELRTPMHAILSFASLALKKSEDKKQTRFLQNIRTSGIRLTNLLNDLLDLSKLEAGKMDGEFIKQDLTTLIEQSIAEMSSLLSDKQIAIKLNSHEHYDCFIDQKMVFRLLVNLLSNAVKFSPESSIIQVKVAQEKMFLNNVSQEALEVSVIDQGVGIPEDQLTTIFEKFIQSSNTKTSSGGTGLGLPICKEIVELHKGKIWAESPPSGQSIGSAFKFIIPVLHPDEVHSIINVHEAINFHQDMKSRVLEIISSKDMDSEMLDEELDSQACPLTVWLESSSLDSDEMNRLKQFHDDFHTQVNEIFAYFETGNDHEVSHRLVEFIELSEKLIESLNNVR